MIKFLCLGDERERFAEHGRAGLFPQGRNGPVLAAGPGRRLRHVLLHLCFCATGPLRTALSINQSIYTPFSQTFQGLGEPNHPSMF